MIPLKKTSTNIIAALTSMALFAGFAGYTNHYDLSKNLPIVNSAPAEINRQEVQPVISKAESVIAKAEQQLPIISAKSAAPTASVAPAAAVVSPVTIPEPAVAPQTSSAASPQTPTAVTQAPIVVAKADTTDVPAPSKKKTTKTRAS